MQNPLKLFANLAIKTRRDAVKKFHDQNLGAQSAPDRAEFKADIATANHQQPLGHRLQIQRTGGRNNPFLIDCNARQIHHLRAGGDDNVLCFKGANLTIARFHLHPAGRGDHRVANDGFGLVLLEEKFDALGQLADHFGLVRHHGGQIEDDIGFDA